MSALTTAEVLARFRARPKPPAPPVSGRAKRPRMVTELGIEAQCPGCRGWWPQDREFFRDGVMVRRACEADRRAR